MFKIFVLLIVSYGRQLQSCSSGQYLNSGNCVACPSDCSTCTDNSADGYPCLTCLNSPTYINDSGVCTSCPSNCASCTYSSPTLACQSCTSNSYYLDNNSLCQACVSPCAQCSSNTQCISCVSTYYFDGSQCQTCAPSCVTCYLDTSVICQTCLSNQYINGNSCYSCTSPCSQCTWDSGNSVEVCSNCINNYFLNGSGICITCLTNEYKNGLQCYPCTSPCDQCTWDSANSVEVCSHCINNYFLNGSGTCITCLTNEYKNGLQCYPCTSPCNQCTWDSVNSLQVCQQCNQYYYVGSSATCQTCSSSGCVDCLYGKNYKQGLDIPSSSVHCTSCSPGKYINASYHCQNCVSPCLLCSGSSGQLCSSCADTYYLDNQTCQPCVSPCLNCSNSTQCLTCRDQFYWDGTQCQACLAPCKHCQAIGPGDSCTSCYPGQYLSSTTCLTCGAKCATCPDGGDGTNCTTCASLRIFDANNLCICQPGYFQDSTDVNLCNQCSQRCQTCVTTAQTCQSCVVSQNTTLQGNECKCAINYYYNTTNQNCVQCVAPCYNCQDGPIGTSCIDCPAGSNRLISGNTCICPSTGFYSVSAQTLCPPCVFPCISCMNNGNGTQCTSCDSTLKFTLSGQACVCMAGYYLTASNTCLVCTGNCQTCTGTSTFCLTCIASSQATPNASGQCIVCVSGYFYQSSGCTQCNFSCATCVSSATNCLSCFASTYRTYNSGSKSCPCDAGYYSVTTIPPALPICLPCKYTCATCTGSTLCATCNTNIPLCTTGCVKRIMKTAGSGICDCLDGYYDINNVQDCGICHYSCQKCSGGALSTNCTGCNLSQQRTLVGNSCPCLTGFYDTGNASAPACLACNSSCKTCSGPLATNCTGCSASKQLSGSTCICNPTGYYGSASVEPCASCHQKCNQCNGGLETNCTACNDTITFRSLKSNQCICKDGYYDLSKTTVVVVCGACHFSCATCNNNLSTSCLTCPALATSGRVQVGNTCLCTTSGKYIESGTQICTLCNLSCKTCSGTVSYCTSCNLNGTRRLDQSTTTNTCPCQNGYYDNNNANCFQCSAPCLHCIWNTSQNKQQCTNCDSTKYLSGITCVNCSASCKTCTLNGNGTQCTSCVDGKYLFNQTCQACYTRCTTCFYDTDIRCTSCDSTHFLNNQDCTTCPTGCSSCALNATTLILECNACYPQFYFDTPITCAPCLGACGTCPSNNGSFCNTCLVTAYFSSANFCTPCTPPCYACSGSATQCTSCIPLMNRVLLSQACPCLTGYYQQFTTSQLCYDCQDPCQNCLDFGDGTQCTSCISGLFRVIDNSINKCVCQDQYYETTYFTCENCDNSCDKCITSDTFCLGCFDNSISKRTFAAATNSCPCDPGYFSLYDTAANCTICDYTCVTCTFASTQCLSCDANVLRSWNSTTQSCPCNPGYYDNTQSDPQCYPCTAPCQNCATFVNGTKCTSCISGLFRALNGTYCNCVAGYYDNLDNGICLPCQPQCQTCSNNSSCDSCFSGYYRQASNCFLCQSPCATCTTLYTCTTCVSGYYKDTVGCQQCSFPCVTCPANGPGYVCQSCADTYHMLQGVCQPCDPMCTRCEEEGSPTQCTVCNASYNRVLSTTNPPTCICGPGFYNTGATICPICNTKCATCVTSSTNCLTCAPGYYMSGGCQTCQLPCATCSSLTQCITCNAQTFRIMVSNQCKCMDGYYDNLSGSSICSSCQPNSCAKCYFNAGDTSPTCTDCTPNLFRLFQSNNCICQDGYYDSGPALCTPCPTICVLCTAATSCQSCTENLFRLLVVDQCNCIEGYYDTGVDICSPCKAPCFGCSGSDTSCTSCNDPLRIINTDLKLCVCITGYFQNTTDGICYACDPSCATCSDGEVNNSCKSCSAGYYASPTDSTVCLQCSDPCQNCFLADDQITQLCSSCKSSLRVTINTDGSGSCICMPNSYRAQTADIFCTQCNSPCYNCQDPGTGTQCLDCVDNFFRQYNPDTLTCNCLMTYYYVDPTQQCFPCLSPCFLCQSGPGSDGTQCTQCLPNLNRVLSTTQPLCPCQDGYFENASKVCQLCVDPCITCTSTSDCLSCKGGLQRYLNGNLCSCNPGYFDVSGTLICAQCNAKCFTCITTSTQCQTCDVNLFRTISGTTCICMSTYYDNGTLIQCQKCSAPCFECLSNINGSKCSSCVVGSNRHITTSNTCECDVGYFDPGPTQQCLPCQPTCTSCNNISYCTSCTDPFVITAAEQGSVCICKSGYTLQNNICVITCPIDCATCDSAGLCLTCNSDRSLINGRCTCQFEGGGQYCRQSCDTVSMQELRQTLRSSSNTIGTRINTISTVGDQTILTQLNSYSTSTAYINQQIGKLISNGALVYFKPGLLLDQSPFGQAYYEKFNKDKIVYWVFERDANSLAFDLTYSYNTVQNVLPAYNIYKQLPFSDWTQYIQQIQLDTISVVLVFTVRGQQTISLSNSVNTTALVTTINVQIAGGSKQPFIINQIIFANTVFSNAQLDSIGLPILQLLDQVQSYECVPHPKTIRQIYLESHQYILSVLPINLIPIQVVNGQNYIQQSLSQNQFGTNGGAIIKLNGNVINYQTLSFQQQVGQYQYSTVNFPDSLFFGLTLFKTFTFTSFTIQHYITSGYSIQQYSLSQSTYLGTYYGFVVDAYGTASVKTIIFGLQNYNINVQQNSNNILITINGAVDQIFTYTFITSDNSQLTQAQYESIFQNQLQLIIRAIQQCSGQQVPLRYVKETLKGSFSSIIPTNIVPLTENATGFNFVGGTNSSNFMFAFQNSHFISTNLNQYVIYTNGFIKDGSVNFGLNTKYFTFSNQIFILGAQLNGIQSFSISLQTNGSTVTCSQYSLITNDGVIQYNSIVSSCSWANSPFLVFSIFMIDQRESSGVTLTQTTATTQATITLNSLNSVTMLYYTTLIGNKTLGFPQANMQSYINSFTQLINNARVQYPCNFQCATLDQNYQCATFRSGYSTNQLIEFNNLISDVNNIGGKKCNYFTFSGAQSNIVSKANSLSNFLLALSNSFNDNINLNNGYLLVDFYEIGRMTSNVKSTPILQNPVQSGLSLSLQTPFYLGAQSQLYSYYQSPIYYSLYETNVDTIYIQNTLNTLSLGSIDQNTFIFNDYGISLQTTCVRFYNNQFYSNIYECFMRQLIPNQNIQVTVVPPAYSSQYTITQTGNAFMVYTVMTSTGQVFPFSTVQAIQYKVYTDFLDQTNEQNCVCWGRYRQQSNNCRCQQGYYPPTLSVTSYGLQDCLPCDFRCATCQFTSSQCLSCPTGVQRVLNTVTSKCECSPGYYDVNVLLCSACDYKCYQCNTSPTNCVECSATNKRTLSGSTCTCMTGFYDDGINQLCQPCHFSCKSCSGPLKTQCTSCEGNNQRQPNGNICECKTGYLEINAAACGICDYTCLGCSGTTNTCTSCPLSSFRTLNNSTCPCNPGYYNIQNQVICAQCSQYCSSCSGPNANQCLSCIPSSNRVISGTNCNCGPGFFQNALNTVNCPACNSTCKTCSGTAINCTSCDNLNFRTLDSLSATCLCNPGYFDDNVNAACQVCAPACLTCQFVATQCLSCKSDTNRYYDSVNKQCPCLPTFSDVGQSSCLKCDHTCQSCQNTANFCTQCNTNGTYRQDMSATNNKCPCMNGYYDDGNNIICQKCHPSCKQCTAFLQCTSCDVTQQRLDQSASGKCPCQNGFYDDNINSTCQTCNYSCATCQTTASNCLSCTTAGTFRYQSGSQCLCQAGYFDNSLLICQQCYFKCKTCQGTANQCTSCPPSRTGALCQCLIGYIESNLQDCLKCANQCGSCLPSNLNSCTTCNLNRANPPTCSCLDGYQEINGVCKQCPLKCDTCDNNGQCATCKPDRINFPECVCPSGYYDNGLVAECQICYSYCQLCTATLCQSCLGNRVLENNGCICPKESQEVVGSPYCNNCQVAAITAQFSDDLSSIIITFPYTIQYNPAKYITLANACSLVFTSSTYNLLGQQPLCSIANQNFIVNLGSSSTITKDSTLNFNTNIMQKLKCFIQIQIFYVVSFTYPTIIPFPQFILSQFPNPLTLCQDIIIQINNVQGDGNRNFPTVEWTVVSISPQNATTAAYLSNLLSTSNKNGMQSLTIQKLSLDPFGTYVIQLKAFNFLNKSFTTQTTFSTSSYEAPILNFASNQDFIFGRWQDIAISVTFTHLECASGVVKEIFDAMRVNWTQISSTNTSRLLQTVTPLLSSSQITETDGMTFIDTLTIPAYTALIGFDYTFLVQIALTNKPIVASQIFTINIQSTDMQAYIEGGTRTQSFGDQAIIAGFCRDPDVMADWNADPDITYKWYCINLVNSLPCTDSNSVPLQLNVTDTSQTFGPRVLSPYQPLQFVMENKKNNISLVTTAIILAIELNLPQITASYPSGYKSRKILLHEELNFTLSTETNPDLLRFYCQILYDYKVVAVFQFNFLQVTFRIWDYFVAVSQNVTQFQIKLAAKDPYNYLPSTVTMNFVLNVPPLGCQLSVSPNQGTSIIDQFYISVTGCQDTDLPLTYQYHLYLSADIMNQDTIKGDTLQKKTLTDPQSSTTQSTVLPTPYNSDGSQAKAVILIVSVYDSEMAVTNLTKSISLQSIQSKVFSGVDFNSILLQIQRSLKLNSVTTPTISMLPSLFIASQELSSLYNSLSSYPQKQTQMKPILQQIYSMVSSFQGKLTSKVMVESLLSSLSAIGCTGITFQQSSTTLIDVKAVRTQILTLSKQLTRQVSDLQYAIQQKYQSGGSTSQYEDQIRSLDNILLNCGLVTDALFNAIKGDTFVGYSDNDMNILKSSIQSLNKQVAEATLLRSVPNQKPKSFAGQQMGMKAYKSTPAQVTSLLASQTQNPIFTDNDDTNSQTDLNGVTPTLSQEANESDDAAAILYLQQHPDLAAQYGFIINSTNSTTNSTSNSTTNSTTNATNGTRILQQVFNNYEMEKYLNILKNRHNTTYRRLQQLDPNQVKQYSVQMKQYETSPYSNDPSFKSALASNITNNGSNTTQSIVSNFGTVDPQINVSQNGNNSQLTSLNGQKISLSFNPPKGLNSTNLTCSSKGTDQWQTGQCQIKKVVASDGKITYACDCQIINPTTVLTTLDSLITNKLNSVFGADSFSTFLNIQFWNYAIFYIAIAFSGVFIYLMINGQKRDNEDFIQLIYKELSTLDALMPEVQQIKSEFREALGPIPEDEAEKEETLLNARQIKQQLQEDQQFGQDAEKVKQLAFASLNAAPIVMKKTDTGIHISNKVVPIVKDRHDELVQLNKDQVDLGSIQRSLAMHDLMGNQKKNFLGKATKLREVIKNVYSINELNYEHGQTIKMKPLSVQLILQGIITLHRVLCILTIYDEVISRSARFALIYAKTILVLALSALFSGNFGPIYSVLISNLVSQVINIILTIITVLMKANPILKFIGIVFTFIVSTVCWYIVIMLSAQMDQTAADAWAIQFISAQISDLVVIECLTISIKLAIYPWTIKALNAPNGEGNTIAHLLFIVVAQPQISQFFSVE